MPVPSLGAAAAPAGPQAPQVLIQQGFQQQAAPAAPSFQAQPPYPGLYIPGVPPPLPAAQQANPFNTPPASVAPPLMATALPAQQQGILQPAVPGAPPTIVIQTGAPQMAEQRGGAYYEQASAAQAGIPVMGQGQGHGHGQGSPRPRHITPRAPKKQLTFGGQQVSPSTRITINKLG